MPGKHVIGLGMVYMPAFLLLFLFFFILYFILLLLFFYVVFFLFCLIELYLVHSYFLAMSYFLQDKMRKNFSILNFGFGSKHL